MTGGLKRWQCLCAIGGFLLLFPGVGSRAKADPGDQFVGYQTSTGGAAVNIIPSLPSFTVVEAPLQGNVSQTLTTLSSGGQGFARASTLYPGDLVAGLGPLLGQAGLPFTVPAYPVVVESRDFDGPKQNDPAPGVLMNADGNGKKASAESVVSGFNVPIALTIGSARSTSLTTLTDTLATATTSSSVSDVKVGGDLLSIDSIKSTATAQTDAKAGTTDGSFSVSGMKVGGVPVTVDQDGVHVQGNNVAAVAAGKLVNGLLTNAQVTVKVLQSVSSPAGADASRTTGGLLISLPLPAAGPVPPGGTLSILLGQTTATTAASPAFSFDGGPDPTTPPPADPGGGGTTFVPGGDGGGSFTPPSSPSTPSLPTGDVSAPPASSAPQSSGSAPTDESVQPVAAYHFGGLPLQMIVGLGLLLPIPGVRLTRKYFERLFELEP